MRLLIILAIICASVTLHSQSTETFPVDSKLKNVRIDLEYGDLVLTESSKNEITLTKKVSINQGLENEKYSVVTRESGSEFTLAASINQEELEYIILGCDEGSNKVVKKDKVDEMKKAGDRWDCYSTSIDVTLELSVPKGVKVYVETLYGDVEIKQASNLKRVEATYGDVTVVNNLGWKDDVKIQSTYGFVDLSIPKSVNADLKLTTSYGEIFTDMDLHKKEHKKFRNTPHGNNVVATMNNGGPSIFLEATYDNIYLRKS